MSDQAGFKVWLNRSFPTRSFPWRIAAVMALAGPLVGFLSWGVEAYRQSKHPPSCFGIGWGCSLHASDVGLLAGILWMLAVAVLVVVLAITELFWRPVAIARSAFAMVVLGLGLAFIALIASGLLRA